MTFGEVQKMTVHLLSKHCLGLSYAALIHFPVMVSWEQYKTKLNSVAFSPQANCTDRAAAACRRS
jgi:hypothetical protein